MTARWGVLLLAHGAVTNLDDLPGFYTHIREGAPTSPRVLETLRERYKAIGGSSPLNSITLSAAAKLQKELESRHGEGTFLSRAGFRHVPPYLDEVLGYLAGEGVTRVIAIPMSPHVSRFVKEGYSNAVARSNPAVEVRMVGPWHLEQSLIGHWSTSISSLLAGFSETDRAATTVLFTAHSLPRRWVEGDDLLTRLRESADRVARGVGIPAARSSLAWQSASPTGEEWLGPDINRVLDTGLPEGTRAVISCPHGFIADHLETLYDIDILARRTAEDRGLAFARTEMPNDSPLLIHALASVVERCLPASGTQDSSQAVEEVR